MQGGRYPDIAGAPQGAHQNALGAVADQGRSGHEQGRHDDGQQDRILGEDPAQGLRQDRHEQRQGGHEHGDGKQSGPARETHLPLILPADRQANMHRRRRAHANRPHIAKGNHVDDNLKGPDRMHT